MGLSSSMYTGVSGLKGHGEKMGTIGNNISNVSTVGFKGSRMHFEDFMSQDINTSAGVGQVGRGVGIGAVMNDFQQGALESTNEATDVAIGGNGFFQVSPMGEDINYYTRAGNFRFNEDGYLVDPHGNVVQGWETAEREVGVAEGEIAAAEDAGVEIQGVPGDIRLEDFQSPPEQTSRVTQGLNLDSRRTSNANDLTVEWNADQDPPYIGETQYAYQNTIQVYDANGTSHDLTTYLDPVDPENPPFDLGDDVIDDAENEYVGGRRAWQFMVTADPAAVENTPGDPGAEGEGILMNGALVFNSAGQLESIRFEDGDEMIEYSDNGYPLAKVDFLGTVEDAEDPGDEGWQNIEMNFGLRASEIDDDQDPPVVGDWERQANATTSFSRSSTTLLESQDGYTAGFLQNVEIDRDGILTGRYSNGQVSALYALTLADFHNLQGLRKEGGNLFSETRSSGPPMTGRAGTNGLGEISSNSLEMSNVDLATEFVKMIQTEKGFQANSKTIQTTDTMLGIIMQMKR